MSQLQCILVTPDRTVCDEAAEFVALPLFDGEIGLAPAHSPMIGRLGWGQMRFRQAKRTVCYYVEGGFVEVVGNVVSVLTNRAIAAEELDEAAIEEQLVAARTRPAHTPEEMAVRDRAVGQSRARLRVARRAK